MARPVHGRHTHEMEAFLDRLDGQALRTHGIRAGVYQRAGLDRAASILDVGCGSGAVTADLTAWTSATVTAVDVEPRMARRTRRAWDGPVLAADGRALPFPDATFDAVVCHLVLMWTPHPVQVVREMARVVRPGGAVVAVMEPDYGGKVHHPENPLIDLVWKGESIRRRGGDPHAGRRLRDHFVAAGLQADVGIGNLDVATPEQDLDQWRRNRRYYRRTLQDSGFAPADIDAWEAEYLQALSDGIQLSWFPFFWAIGRRPVPGDVDRA